LSTVFPEKIIPLNQFPKSSLNGFEMITPETILPREH
jgi:hypothetical protein